LSGLVASRVAGKLNRSSADSKLSASRLKEKLETSLHKLDYSF